MSAKQRHMTPNAVARAIQTFGGMTKTVVATGLSEATWHRWRRAGRIADSDICFMVSDLTGIPARELAGMGTTGPSGDDADAPSATATQAVAQTRRATREIASVVARIGARKQGRKYPCYPRRNPAVALAPVIARTPSHLRPAA